MAQRHKPFKPSSTLSPSRHKYLKWY